MKISNRHTAIIAAAVFFLAAGCARQSPADTGSPGTNLEKNQPVQSAATSPPAVSTTTESEKPATTNADNIVQTVEGSKILEQPYEFVSGQTALDILKIRHQVQTKSYGSMGEFVLAIDGMASDSKHFWEFYVNGKSSSVGAGSYQVKAGDKLEWKLTVIK